MPVSLYGRFLFTEKTVFYNNSKKINALRTDLFPPTRLQSGGNSDRVEFLKLADDFAFRFTRREIVQNCDKAGPSVLIIEGSDRYSDLGRMRLPNFTK